MSLFFFTDPNQASLLEYCNQKIVYLIRDPNILQEQKTANNERELIKKADLILATSKKLANNYLKKYYDTQPKNIFYWPNSVDFNLWNPSINWLRPRSNIIGIAGNFDPVRTDYALLDRLTTELSNFQFQIAGKPDSSSSTDFWKKLLKKPNVMHIGFIPQDKLPQYVCTWNVGLISDKICEYSSYMHHNKVYQYLALGIPVVSLKIHSDYDHLAPYVQCTNDEKEFHALIIEQSTKAQNNEFRNECVEIAKKNTSNIRAESFIEKILAL
jgi:teichuronic acid biosynthesis glycosyltransferase TuaH